MNWTDLPLCNGAWDVDLNAGKAHCSQTLNLWPYPLLALLALLALREFISWQQKRRKMQAKFTLSFVISAPQIQAADLTFPDVVGQPESGNMQLSGGTPPYKVSVDDSTTLPPGVSVDAQGNVSGTPTQAGTFSVPVTVTDSGA